MYILGLNAYHGDSSACLLIDGKLICAIEEERIRRIKYWAGFPSESIKWCLDYSKIKIEELDYIALSRNPFSKLHKKALRIFTKRPAASFIKHRFDSYLDINSIKQTFAKCFSSPGIKIKAKIVFVEHHRAHIASSFFVSPFKEAAVVSIDGFGDFTSTMIGIGKNNRIKILGSVEFPHSLGILYTAVTQFLGFWNYGDEYKVMGLSAYGSPVYKEKILQLVKLTGNGLFQLDQPYFLHDKGEVKMTWMDSSPRIGRLFSDKIVSLIGEPRKDEEEIGARFQDVAASLQSAYEHIFFHILNSLYKKTGLKNISLGGGCLQNSLANGKITDNTNFNQVYIPIAPHDAGGAIGAAFYVWNASLKNDRSFIPESPYLGPNFNKSEIEASLKKQEVTYKQLKESELLKETSKAISEGKIVGWFQGRTEFGPRALGNRSILVDPRRREMKDILNERIKKREWFRPFAPSILEEKTAEWFERSSSTPFMGKVYSIKKEKRELIPAVCHVDGTGRLQTVSFKSNPKLYSLIKEFEKITGVPILLNTSFNENEPIVNTVEDALKCFVKTSMDILIIENYFIERRT